MYKTIKPPTILSEIGLPPSKLYIKGELDSDSICVAIVGSRRPTQEGAKTAYQLAGELSSHGVIIVSGLAYGIDVKAHQGAIDAKGKTIAVLPCGIESVYPSAHTQIAKKIIELNGAVISEFPGKHRPRQYDFLARNRLIAGLSQVTIIVEAARRSGALNTARHALEANREVLAVPGSIYSPLSEGPNNLIKQGAMPITSVDDVFNILGIEKANQDQLAMADTPQEKQLLEILGDSVADMDKLLKNSSLPSGELLSIISELEVKGVVERLPGNYIKKRYRC